MANPLLTWQMLGVSTDLVLVQSANKIPIASSPLLQRPSSPTLDPQAGSRRRRIFIIGKCYCIYIASSVIQSRLQIVRKGTVKGKDSTTMRTLVRNLFVRN